MRIGNIALLSGDPINTTYKGFMEAYLVEARSIGGLSGSPVFVSSPMGSGQIKFYLLGLMHGHFDIADLNSDVVSDQQGGSINTGIGVVIPSRHIIDTLQHPDLSALRKEIAMRNRKRAGATPDLAETPALEKTSLEEGGPNPQHREDFTRLVSAASKRKPKGDRT